ncbi:TraR/DksA family transcriptional regulator [Chromatiaceae bacterium AAb-1]|nr:TraR/DksA family transcriptional regulator [Chromatiaceae bacterium AAb-1]
MPVQQRKLKLLQQRCRLERQLAAIHHDFQRGRSARFSEQATERGNDLVLNELEHTIAAELAQIATALKQLEVGNPRHCQRCGKEISQSRLDAIPYTTLCIKCAAQ